MNQPKLPPNGFENGKTYRFRTLIDGAIGMGEPAGTVFSASSSDWDVEFEGREGPSYMTCGHPAHWIDCGDIEWLPDLYGNEEDE
jgi:hypothetical protein